MADDDLYMDESGTIEGDNDDEDNEDDDLYIIHFLVVKSAILIILLLQALEQAIWVLYKLYPLTLLKYFEDLNLASESDDNILL